MTAVIRKAKKFKINYSKYTDSPDKISLSDALAVERTLLANERTYLSYTRTAVSFAVAAISLSSVLSGWTGKITMAMLLTAALYFFIRGLRITRSVDEALKQFEDN